MATGPTGQSVMITVGGKIMRKVTNLLAILGCLLLTWFVVPASLQTTIANNAADMSGKIVMVADSATPRTVTNLFTFNRGGTNAPFAVGNSGAVTVTNLDADKLDGLDSVRYKQTVVTTTSTGTQNNFDPSSTIASGAQIVVIRCNNAADLTITGLVAGVDGQIVILYPINASGNVFLQDASGGAGSTIELSNVLTSGPTPVSLRGYAMYSYDATSTVWRLHGHNQGSWITPTFTAGTYTANGGGTWTVASGDVTTYRYLVSGRTITISIETDTSTIAGTVGSLNIFLPLGYTAITINRMPALVMDNSLTVSVAATVQTTAAGFTMTVALLNSATNFAASVDQTSVRFVITFEVT